LEMGVSQTICPCCFQLWSPDLILTSS
jgi:hypothetical protein